MASTHEDRNPRITRKIKCFARGRRGPRGATQQTTPDSRPDRLRLLLQAARGGQEVGITIARTMLPSKRICMRPMLQYDHGWMLLGVVSGRDMSIPLSDVLEVELT